jgi:hypothetical protein
VKFWAAQQTLPPQQSPLFWQALPSVWQQAVLHTPVPPLGPAQQRFPTQQSAVSPQAVPGGSQAHTPAGLQPPLQHWVPVEHTLLAWPHDSRQWPP